MSTIKLDDLQKALSETGQYPLATKADITTPGKPSLENRLSALESFSPTLENIISNKKEYIFKISDIQLKY